MIIPFDIDAAKELEEKEPGEHIVTKEGNKKVRIVCWDAFDQYPIVATIEGYSDPFKFTKEGLDMTSSELFDLVLVVPDPEFTEIDEKIRDFIKNKLCTPSGWGNVENYKENIEELKKLLEEADGGPYFVELPRGKVGTTLVRVTKDYYEHQLNRHAEGLDHVCVFGYDEPGFIYDTRRCKVCGRTDII